jgi:hypothetical protein
VISFDRGPSEVLALCGCGARELCLSQGEADSWAVEHLTRHDQLERERREHLEQQAQRQRVVASVQERQRRHAR